jgi:Carboxypeptidase regulatory-like domain
MTTVPPDFEAADIPTAVVPEASGAPQALAVPDSALAAEPATAPAPAPIKVAPAGIHLSLAGFQTVIGLTAGLLSILGALLAVPGLLGGGPSKGDVVTIVREAKTERALPGAVVEILTSNNAIVTTLRANSHGRTRYALIEGPYRIRVSHPRYASETRDVQVLPSQASEIPVRLRVTAAR